MHEKTYYTFEDLGTDDGGRAEVRDAGSSLGVFHREDEGGVLNDEDDEGDIFRGHAMDGGCRCESQSTLSVSLEKERTFSHGERGRCVGSVSVGVILPFRAHARETMVGAARLGAEAS